VLFFIQSYMNKDTKKPDDASQMTSYREFILYVVL